MSIAPSPLRPTGGFDRSTLAAWTQDADATRLTRYRQALDFYNGTQYTARRRAGETRLVMNYARALVRKGVSYLFTDDPEFVALGADGKKDANSEAVEGVLSEWIAANEQHDLDWQSALDAAVIGDGAYKVTWSARLKRPVCAAVDPRGLWAFWWPDNPRQAYRVIQRIEMRAEEARAIYSLQIAVGTSPAANVVVVEDWTAEQLVIEVSGMVVRRGANPYGYIPFVLWRNAAAPYEFWGESDLIDLMGPLEELNTRFTTASRILQVAGYPIAVLENVDGAEAIRAEAGAVWELPEGSRAYLLDLLANGGMAHHTDYIDLLYRAVHDLAETPRTSFGDSGRSLSGVALEVEIQPLIQKVHRKRRIWDGVYRRRNSMILDQLQRMGGVETFGLRRTAPVWPDVLPSDRDAAVRNEVALVQGEIHSRRYAARQLGDEDPDALHAEVLAEIDELRARADAAQAAASSQNDPGGAQSGNAG